MQKLSAQFENNLSRMEEIKFMRNQYFLAHDQLFFPLNIEVRVSCHINMKEMNGTSKFVEEVYDSWVEIFTTRSVVIIASFA
jgi:hypothetical protein